LSDYGDIEEIDTTPKRRGRKSKGLQPTPKNIMDKLLTYKLFHKLENDIMFFGKINVTNGIATAEFICNCGEPFRSELQPILSGKIKKCSKC
jgi:hypothetical protein